MLFQEFSEELNSNELMTDENGVTLTANKHEKLSETSGLKYVLACFGYEIY
jgi:hypothetical protein